jgi:hypothetical protein
MAMLYQRITIGAISFFMQPPVSSWSQLRAVPG